MTHAVILFREERKKRHFGPITQAIVGVHSYETRCRGEGWGVGGGEERYSAKAQLQTSLLCWMKAELQLAGAFRVLFMGSPWKKKKGVRCCEKPFRFAQSRLFLPPKKCCL